MDVLHVVREAFSNIAQHAAATRAEVSLAFTGTGLTLSIGDNGSGLEPETGNSSLQSPQGGMGLRGMRERSRLLNGGLQIKSEHSQGTQVILTIADLNQTAAVPLYEHPEYAQHQPGEGSGKGASGSAEGSTPSGENGELITIVLADDHPALRSGLRLALSKVAGLRVIGVASSGGDALMLTRELRPDILLLDVQLPDQDGLSVLRNLRFEQIPTRVVMLTAHFADAYITEALRNGAAGFLNKDIEIEDLVQAIRTAHHGHMALSPTVAARMRDRDGLLVNPGASHFTVREREVLDLLAAGMSYQAIGRRLCIAEATVKFHAINLYQKLQCHSRVEALNQAREWGLLRPR